MDCGNPKCYLCGNPRVTHKDRLTAQEKRLFQDLDNTNDKHSNGMPKDIDNWKVIKYNINNKYYMKCYYKIIINS